MAVASMALALAAPSDARADVYAVDADEALFLPKSLAVEAWTPTILWADSPKPGKAGLPEGWKGLTVRFSEKDGHPVAKIEAPEGTDFYGTGEVNGPLRRNGKQIVFWNSDNYGYTSLGGARLYQSHPWVLGVRPDGTAFGVIADCTHRGTLRLGERDITFSFEGGPFPVWVTEAASPQDALRKLAARTGRMPMPPLWALGYQQSRYGYRSAAECLEIADTMRERKIPCDVIWMDIDYMDGRRPFTFDPKGFPDPKGYMAELHKRDFHGVWMVDPALKNEPNAGYAAFDEGEKRDVWVKRADGKTDFVGLVWPGECKFPDFTRKAVRDWWTDLNTRFVTENAIDGLWNDMNEPAVFGGLGKTMPADNLHGGTEPGDLPPGPHVRYHNIYGMLMISATREALLRAYPDRRPFVLTRANFLGGHRYGYTWTGDNFSIVRHMRAAVPMSLNLALSGQPFNGPDLGGHGKDCSAELLRQWVGFGAFFPFCRNHAASGTRAQEPWAYDLATEETFRTAIRRRYALIPYLYTLMHGAATAGDAVMAPAFFADPTDLSLRREEQAFLLGRDLLVVPAHAEAPALPKGDWREARLLDGDPAETQPDHARLLVRPGAALPAVAPADHVGALDLATLTLHVNPGPDGKAEGLLYEDAGDGYGFEKGDFRLTRFVVTTEGPEPKVAAEHVAGERPSAVRDVKVILLPSASPSQADAAPNAN